MDVSVIIVNFKTSQLIADCVKSIISLTHDVEYEVIIVDNNSEPDFETIISQKIPSESQDNFHFISLPENIGFGRANNEGLKIAKGRNILFLNPDTLLLNNAIKILSEFLDTHNEAGACGGNLFDIDKKPTYSYKMQLPGIAWELNELFNNKLHIGLYGKISHFYNTGRNPLQVAFITGADLMVKKQVLDSAGAFSDAFFMYFEETDLCARIKRAGWKIYSIPQAHIQHLESKSFEKTDKWESELKTALLEESRHIYYKRNYGKMKRWYANFIYDLFLQSRISLIRNKSKKDYYKLRRKHFKGKK